MVGYNVQSAVDTKHHLIVSHEVTNVVLTGACYPVCLSRRVQRLVLRPSRL
jgi:hypothetical protein